MLHIASKTMRLQHKIKRRHLYNNTTASYGPLNNKWYEYILWTLIRGEPLIDLIVYLFIYPCLYYLNAISNLCWYDCSVCSPFHMHSACGKESTLPLSSMRIHEKPKQGEHQRRPKRVRIWMTLIKSDTAERRRCSWSVILIIPSPLMFQ